MCVLNGGANSSRRSRQSLECVSQAPRLSRATVESASGAADTDLIYFFLLLFVDPHPPPHGPFFPLPSSSPPPPSFLAPPFPLSVFFLSFPFLLFCSCYFFLRSRSSPQARRAAFDAAAGGVLLTGFFFYIVTSTLVLEAFDCQEFDDGSSYLKADFRISCKSNMYTFIYVSAPH